MSRPASRMYELDAPRRLTTIGEHMSDGRLRVFSGFRVPAD